MKKKRENLLATGFVYSLVGFSPIFVQLLVTPIITRTLGGENYGIVSIGISLYQFLAMMLALGLETPIALFASRESAKSRVTVTMVFLGAIVSSLIAGLLFSLLPFWGELMLQGSTSIWILAAPLISSVALSTLSLTLTIFRSIRRSSTFVFISALSSFSGPGIGLLLVFLVSPTPESYLIGIAIGQSIAVVIALALLPSRMPLSQLNKKIIIKYFGMGLPTLPHSVTISFLGLILIVLTTIHLGPESSGRMQLSILFGTAPLIVLGAFNNSWAPMIYRAEEFSRDEILKRSIGLFALIALVVISGFVLLISPVAEFISGPELFSSDLVEASLVISTSTAFQVLYLSNIHLVFLSQKTKLLAITTPISMASAVFYIEIINFMGFKSLVSIATAIPLFYFLQWIMSIFLRRRTGFPRPKLSAGLPAIILVLVVPLIFLCVQLNEFVVFVCLAIVILLLGILNRNNVVIHG